MKPCWKKKYEKTDLEEPEMQYGTEAFQDSGGQFRGQHKPTDSGGRQVRERRVQRLDKARA